MPRYWTRQQWKAKLPLRPIPQLSKQLPVVYVHHDAGPFMSDPVRTIQGIQNAHQAKRWLDIAYGEWVAYTGDCFEARGIDVVDGATAGQSGESMSICLQGNFENVIPTAVQIDTVVNRIVAYAQEGRLAAGFEIRAHQQAPPYFNSRGVNLNATQCCGKFLLERLPEIRARVASALSPSTPIPPMTETDMYYLYVLHTAALNPGEPRDWIVTPGGEKFACPSTHYLNALRTAGARTIDLSADQDASEVFRGSHP